MGMMMVQALSFTACKSVEKKEDAVTTEAVETKNTAEETTEIKKTDTKETSLILGQIDGEVYANKMFNIKSGNRIVNIVYVTTDANLAKTVMDMFTKVEQYVLE